MAQTRLLIVPSDFVAWPGLIDQLRAVETVRVVGVTRSWSEALRVGEISRPNVVLAAEPCGDEPVLQPLRQMRRILPNATFVILTTSFDPDHLLMLAEVGVSGYLRWDGLTSYDTLPHLAIAMNGKTYQFAGIVDSATQADGDTIKVNNEGTIREDSQTKETITRGGIGAALGAIIGAIAGGGKGAAIGAGVGAGAGVGSILLQGSDDLELEQGSQFTITATAPTRGRS